MNGTGQKTEPTVRTEWGTKRTWPDGHIEYKRADDRSQAEFSVGVRHPDGRTTEVVTRTVTTTPWTPVA